MCTPLARWNCKDIIIRSRDCVFHIVGCNWKKCESASAAGRAQKTAQMASAIWSAATRRFPSDAQGHSGDKSPHSKRAVIVYLHLTKTEREATRTSSNCTRYRLKI